MVWTNLRKSKNVSSFYFSFSFSFLIILRTSFLPALVTCGNFPPAAQASQWTLLFRQTSPTFLNPASKWLSVNPTKPKAPNYSILNTLDDKCKDDKGKFDTNPNP